MEMKAANVTALGINFFAEWQGSLTNKWMKKADSVSYLHKK